MLKRSWSVVLALAFGIVLGSIGAVVAAETFNGLPVVAVIVNGKPIQSEVPGVILADKTMLPVRAIADALGLDVKWDGVTRTVTLTSKATAPAPKDSVYSDEYVSVSNVTVRKNALDMTEVLIEVTNVNSKTVFGFLSVTFYDANGGILGKAVGAVTDLTPGSTKTVSLIEANDLTGYARYKVQTDTMLTK